MVELNLQLKSSMTFWQRLKPKALGVFLAKQWIYRCWDWKVNPNDIYGESGIPDTHRQILLHHQNTCQFEPGM